MSFLGSFLGHVASSAFDAHTQRQNMVKQLNLQKELFQYENTNKHQFEVQDLKAAGLNPILSATNGSALGVGGVGLGSSIGTDNPYNSAKALDMQRKQMSIEQQNADSQTKNAGSNALLAGTQSKLNEKSTELAEENRKSVIKNVELAEAKNKSDIANNTLVANAKAAYFAAAGDAATTTANANSARAYQDVAESLERMKGYEPERGYKRQQTLNLMGQFSALQLDNYLRERRNVAFSTPFVGPLIAAGVNPARLFTK